MNHKTWNMNHKTSKTKNKIVSSFMSRDSFERGFSLVEILVGSAIISTSLLAIIVVGGRSVVLSNRALHTYQASTLLEEGAESVRLVRDGAWSNISSLTAGTTYYPAFNSSTNTWTLSTTSSDGTVGQFTRSVVLSTVNRDSTTKDIVSSGGSSDTGTRLATVTVSWTESGVSVSKVLQFYISDIFS